MKKFLFTVVVSLLSTNLQAGPCNAVLPNAIDFNVDALNRKPISPYIYGSNFMYWMQTEWSEADANKLTIGRFGGTSVSAHNWERNATHNFGYNFSDGIMKEPQRYPKPGEATGQIISQFFKHKAAAIIQIPMLPWLAADDRCCEQTGDASPTNLRFKANSAKKGLPFSFTPDLNDNVVYQDEYINWIENKYRLSGNPPIFYELDNEPELWSHSLHDIWPAPLGYDQYIERFIEFARAVKTVNPNALVFGPALAHHGGRTRLDNNPTDPIDPATGKAYDFTNYFLEKMSEAEKRYGRRLLDVFSFHHYLWYDAPVDMLFRSPPPWHGVIPTTLQMIDRYYPGTKLAFTEYNSSESGSLDQITMTLRDVEFLGVFGREGLFAATAWGYRHGAMRLFRNYDGKGSSFGDFSLAMQGYNDYSLVTDRELPTTVTGFSSWNSKNNKIVIIMLNATDKDEAVNLRIKNTPTTYSSRVESYRVNKDALTPTFVPNDNRLVDKCGLNFKLSAKSAYTFVLTPK